MAVLPAPKELTIQSHTGAYTARFSRGVLREFATHRRPNEFVLIDDRVADLYYQELNSVIEAPSTLRIEAVEENKSLERCPDYVEHLIGQGIRRGDRLVGIGGGIVQDITCFLAATLLRGLEWHFIPTTLLAQADSCIGSKSSINVRGAKNIVGTFTPPAQVNIDVTLLDTLDEIDLRSGIGEMLKVHAISGPDDFDRIARDYSRLLVDRGLLEHYIAESLERKRRLIEIDEFDRGPRNLMNYGHSFGHAIEASTGYSIPHGIAITIGMDMANHVARDLGFTTPEHVGRMHPVLAANYRGVERTTIPITDLLTALSKDKKNTATKLRLVLPQDDGFVAVVEQVPDDQFRNACERFLVTVASP